MNELFEIQQRLKAPKNEYNEFGKFNYRSLETILSSVKPLLKELECTITFSDEVLCIGNVNYVKSTATLQNSSNEKFTATAYAQEGEHKGMSSPQWTGTASSYARKYAICSLLAIDDNADPDMLDNSTEKHKPATNHNSNFTEQDFIDWCSRKVEEGEDRSQVARFYKFWTSPSKFVDGKKTFEAVKGGFNVEIKWKEHLNKVAS